MKKVSLSILVLVALALTLDFKISSWILLIASSYWYFFLFMHHDLFFARGDLIIGNEGRYSNIWRKLDIKVDSKLLLLFAAATILLWAALFYCYSRTEVLSDSNPYLYSLCLIVALGLIRMCAIEEKLIVWILLTLVASASLVIYSFYIEWNIAKYYNIPVAHSTIVNEKRVNTILFEGNEYNIYSSSSSIDGDDIEFVVHRSIFGNVYAREN